MKDTEPRMICTGSSNCKKKCFHNGDHPVEKLGTYALKCQHKDKDNAMCIKKENKK